MAIFSHFRKVDDGVHKCSITSDGSKSFLPPLPRRATFFQRFRRALKKSTLIYEENPQSTEYFRSTAEILRVRKDHVDSKSWIIHPFSKFRTYYEMYMSLVWLVVLVYMPANAAFDLDNKEHLCEIEMSEILMKWEDRDSMFNIFLKTICLIDIIITFITGYPVKQKRKVVMKLLKIAKHYGISLYFLTDLLASFPFEVCYSDPYSDRTVATLGLVRIMRLPTLYHYSTRTIEIFGFKNIYVETLKNLIINYLVFHWFACMQYAIPQIRCMMHQDIPATSWVEKEDLRELDFISKYIVCFYRAVGSLFCITFEAINIDVWEEKLVAIITYIFGKVYVFYITVLVLNYLLRKGSLEIKYFEVISQVQAYMSQKQLPIAMQTRILQFYDYRYNKKFFKDRGITSLLSEKLRGEINLSICSKLVQNVEILSHLPQNQLEQVVINLKPEIYLANDIIIKAGSVGDCMYFLASGTVSVWTPSGKEVCHLQDGAYFGEVSLVFKDKRRTANIVAIEICEVYKLDRKAFKNCFKTDSQLYKMLETVATERMEITQLYEDIHAKTFLELTH